MGANALQFDKLKEENICFERMDNNLPLAFKINVFNFILLIKRIIRIYLFLYELKSYYS